MTTLVILALRRRPLLRASALSCAAARGFTLVYAGERYVVDELAVIAIALLAWSERLASLPHAPGARSGFPGLAWER